MFKIYRITAILLACFFVLFSGAAFASSASTYVDISDSAYRSLDQLIVWNLCDVPILDQRPFSRGEFARLIAQARSRLNKRKTHPYGDNENYKRVAKDFDLLFYQDKIVGRLEHKFADELADMENDAPFFRLHPMENGSLEIRYASESPVVIPYNNGVGIISASVMPMQSYDEGRHGVDGFRSILSSTHRLRLSRYFSAVFMPEFIGEGWRTSAHSDYAGFHVHEAYGVFQFGNFAMDFGRSPIVWGPAEHGGLLFTDNARALDQIRISTPSPFRLPWIFKHIGKWRASFFGANFGPERQKKYAWLAGYRISYMPIDIIEMGFGSVTMMGGENAPSMSALDVFGEFFGFRPAGTSPTAPNETNHIMEASLSFRIPPLAGLRIYGILANEDKRDTFKRFFRDGSSYLFGAYFPKIGRLAKSDFRVEFRRTCSIQYRHGLYSDGYTLNNLLIGDDLGPDALGLHAVYDMEINSKFSLKMAMDWEKRRSDIHATTRDPDGTLGDIIVSVDNPDETRYNFVLSPSFKIGKIKFDVIGGYSRVSNAGFVDGLSRNDWLMALSIGMNFGNKVEIK